MKIALLSATEKDPRREALRAAALYLLQHGAAAVYFDAAAEKAFSTEPLQPCFLPAEELYGAGDVLLVLGGDGSIIRAARLCGGASRNSRHQSRARRFPGGGGEAANRAFGCAFAR